MDAHMIVANDSELQELTRFGHNINIFIKYYYNNFMKYVEICLLYFQVIKAEDEVKRDLDFFLLASKNACPQRWLQNFPPVQF